MAKTEQQKALICITAYRQLVTHGVLDEDFSTAKQVLSNINKLYGKHLSPLRKQIASKK